LYCKAGFKEIMIDHTQDYSLYLKFIKTFSPTGFTMLDGDHPLLVEIEKMTEQNDQFIHCGDILQMKIHFVSKRCTQMIGIAPEELSPYHFFEATHPEDMHRHSLARAKLFKLAHDFYQAEKGSAVLSTNLRIRNPLGGFTDMVFQLYIFYSTLPYKSVFLLKVHTNIEWFKMRKNGYHYYVGNDLSNFRYPDEKLLMIGNPLSDREFEIVKLIESGLTTEQIAKKLFLSPYTINTHRANVLEKTGKTHIADVIYDFTEQGLM